MPFIELGETDSVFPTWRPVSWYIRNPHVGMGSPGIDVRTNRWTTGRLVHGVTWSELVIHEETPWANATRKLVMSVRYDCALVSLWHGVFYAVDRVSGARALVGAEGYLLVL